MGAAEIRKVPDRLKLVTELIAHPMQTRIPTTVRIAGSARGGAVITGVPFPFDLISYLNRDGTGRKGITARADTDGVCLRERDLS